VIDLIKASPADAYRIAQVRHLVWDETYRGIYPDEMIDGYDLETQAQRFAEKLADPNHHHFIFMDSTTCVGFFSFGPYNYGTYKDFALCLNHLYIRNGYKGMGLGRQAFSVIREYCRSQGIDRFFCGCNANNTPAMGFYRHMGGIQGDRHRTDVPTEDQIVHFEFHIGEKI
jgi:GNAT superfamily N-acetyltransferase